MMSFANVICLFVVIHTTVYANYLLVELQNEEHEQSDQFLAKAACDATRYAWATAIVSTCPGYKLLHTSSNPITAYTMCCEAVKADPECGNSWFKGPVTGKCFCEKKGYDCIRTAGVYTEYRFKAPESEKFLQPQTRDLSEQLLQPQTREIMSIQASDSDECNTPPEKRFCTLVASIPPVCGSDGRTYVNYCTFKWAQCANPSLEEDKERASCEISRIPTSLDQCVARTKNAPNPWDNCNSCGCGNGCFTRMCTAAGCSRGHRFENELCSLKPMGFNDECDAGLKCTDVKDGCKNDVGRCKKE